MAIKSSVHSECIYLSVYTECSTSLTQSRPPLAQVSHHRVGPISLQNNASYFFNCYKQLTEHNTLDLNVFKHFIYVFESQRHREVFHLLIDSPNGHNDCGWAKPKPRAYSSIRISHMREEAQALRPSAAFPGTSAGSSSGVEQPDLNRYLRGFQHHRWQVNALCYKSSCNLISFNF